jgi:hypothetical protein
MQGNGANTIIVTHKVKAFIGKLGLWVRKLRRKDNFDMFSRLKDFVEERDVKTSDSAVDECIRDHLVSLQSRLSKYFSEAVNINGSWIRSMLIHNKITNFS